MHLKIVYSKHLLLNYIAQKYQIYYSIESKLRNKANMKMTIFICWNMEQVNGLSTPAERP